MRQRINFCGPTFEARDGRINDQVAVNMYPRPTGPQARAPVVLYSLPGLKYRQTVGVGPHRGKPIKFGTSWFTVSRGEFYEVSSSGVATVRGTLNTTSGRIKMVKNFSTQILVIDGTYGYIWNGTTLTQIADPDFPANPIDCAYLDSYFIVVAGGTNNFYISDLENGTSWVATEYGVTQQRADNLKAISTATGDVWLPGEESLEIWTNTGNATFPFQVIKGLLFDYGTLATHSIEALDANPIWLSNTPFGGNIIVTGVGRQPKILSDDDLNWQLSQLTRTDDAVAMVYYQAGVPFYILTFPTDGVTYGLDIQTGWWHKRESPDGGAWEPAGLIFYGNEHIAVSSVDGNVYTLDFDTHTDNAQNRRRLRRAAVLEDRGLKTAHNSLEVLCSVGVGTMTGEGVNPQAVLRYSDDGGSTWSHDLPQPLGVQGARDTRLIWDQLGDTYGRIYELRCDHPVEFNIIDAWLDWERADGVQTKGKR